MTMQAGWQACLFIALLLPSLSAASAKPKGWCSEQFHWNEDLKGVKLLDDCELLKDQILDCLDVVAIVLHQTWQERDQSCFLGLLQRYILNYIGQTLDQPCHLECDEILIVNEYLHD